MAQTQTGAHLPVPNLTGSEGFADWLSIAEAVIHCSNTGLPRTSKTIRKWAVRAHADADEAEMTARREDTENGFRWMVYRDWLDRRIAEELEFEARKRSERVATGNDLSEPVTSQKSPAVLSEPLSHSSELVGTGEGEASEPPPEFLRDQVSEKDRQIAKLHEQLERKDEQIMTMLERDRETNILIKGLQGTLERTLGLDKPKDEWEGDSGPRSSVNDV